MSQVVAGPAPSPCEQWLERYPAEWWVLHTRARAEKKVAGQLERAEIKYYLPLVDVRHTYQKAHVTFHNVLFTGYVFLNGNHDDQHAARMIQHVANIIPVVDQDTFRSELVQIYRAIESGVAVNLYPRLRVGERCRIVDGPLKDVEGIVVREGARCRMFLSVSMLGQSAVVEVDAGLLERIETPAPRGR